MYILSSDSEIIIKATVKSDNKTLVVITGLFLMKWSFVQIRQIFLLLFFIAVLLKLQVCWAGEVGGRIAYIVLW